MCCFVRFNRLKQIQNTNYADFDILNETCVEIANLAD